ncbi:hypothetical protein J3R30DRAFT_155590 [Lentinula aciculospora]|uniref:Uncharacterized protein n=1 Tax=Lentinula aciculospora TaxID=153920 RepID=A0A9W9DY67_9AGAR|nr:hypothetical protein J3R30DRAFT_155590 [Lentinula aciculospora]
MLPLKVLVPFLTALQTVQAAFIPISRSFPSCNSSEITLLQLDAIINGTTCPLNGSQFLDECRTAAQALPFVNKGFADYNITTVGEKAALLSLMSFESGGFQFNINHFPGNPGQGTRNLMEFPSVYEYALSIPFLTNQTLALIPHLKHNTSVSYASLSSLSNSLSTQTKNVIRAVVLGDGLSFASAMWFYTQSGASQLGQAGPGCLNIPGMVQGLQAQTQAGWQNYISNCVGTTVTDERRASYLRTLKILDGGV